MVYNAVGIEYDDLKSVLRRVRKGRGRSHLADKSWIHRKLLEACVDFTKRGFRIVDKMVIGRLCVAFRELRIAAGRLSIFFAGETKALEMQVHYRTRGVFKWAPKLEAWLETEGYRFWLGIIQYSLASHACPGSKVEGCQSG